MKLSLVLRDAQSAHKSLTELWTQIKPWLIAGHVLGLSVRAETRSSAQNRRMWAMLQEISTQVDWYGQKLSKEEWKDVLSASLKKQRAVPGIDGGFVVLGASTSKMDKAEMSELQDLIEAFGAQKGVVFADQGLP